MTHSARLRLLLAAIILHVLLVVAAIAVGVAAARDALRVPEVSRTALWWFVYRPASSLSTRTAYICLVGMLLVTLAFAVRLRRLFAQTGSPEVFFFFFFLCSVGLETLRLPALLLAREPAALPLLLSRIVYAGRLLGVLCLFAASLYCLDVRYTRLGTLLGIAVALAVLFGYMVPLDSSMFLANGLYRLGDERGTAVVFFSLCLLLAANPVVTAIRDQSREPILLAVGLLLAASGRELAQFAAAAPSGAAGVLLLAAGSLCLLRRWKQASVVM